MTMTATPETPARPDAAAAARRAFAAIAGMLARLAAEVARRRRHASARAALEAMDDKMLADIGLSRAEIGFRVSEGRDPGRRRASPPPAIKPGGAPRASAPARGPSRV